MIRAVLISIAIGGLAACSTTATLFPVEGPLSESVPTPQVKATVNGILGNSGSLSLTMPDGEYCTGQWSSAAGAGISTTSGSLFGTYGSVYGTATTISTGYGQNPGAAVLTCDRGRNFQIEFVTGAGTATGFGFAKDNKGNVYRVLF